MRWMWLVVVVLMGCGAESLDSNPDDAAANVAADAGESAPEVPLCPGEEPPGTDECQTLVYAPNAGYCNRWDPCGSL